MKRKLFLMFGAFLLTVSVVFAAASYPGAVKSFTIKTNRVDVYDAAHINDLQYEVEAIETELGTDPAGTKTDVKSRLAVLMDDDGSVASGTSFPGSPVDSQMFYRTDLNTTYVYNGSTWDALGGNLSSTLFEYHGSVDASQGASVGEYSGTSLTPNDATGNYRFLQHTHDQTYATAWTTKWKKISGVSTVTIYCRIWVRSGNADLKVDIGGANNNVTGTTSQTTPEWKTFTIDVSGLSNGTVYDVTASMRNSSANDEVFCADIIGFGS